MRPQHAQPEEYLYLKENGIDIDTCEIDYKIISVRCEDLSLYRKAFRVKIRALLKEDDIVALRRYVNQFYTLAQFVQYLYGFHSCAATVEPWQEELAHSLQTKFSESYTQVYTSDSWISYKGVEEYKELLKKKYIDSTLGEKVEVATCIQDEKPFLNLKDRAHFKKCDIS